MTTLLPFPRARDSALTLLQRRAGLAGGRLLPRGSRGAGGGPAVRVPPLRSLPGQRRSAAPGAAAASRPGHPGHRGRCPSASSRAGC